MEGGADMRKGACFLVLFFLVFSPGGVCFSEEQKEEKVSWVDDLIICVQDVIGREIGIFDQLNYALLRETGRARGLYGLLIDVRSAWMVLDKNGREESFSEKFPGDCATIWNPMAGKRPKVRCAVQIPIFIVVLKSGRVMSFGLEYEWIPLDAGVRKKFDDCYGQMLEKFRNAMDI